MCCLPKLPRAVREKDAEMFREQMSKPDLVFLTHENQAMVESAKIAQENENG